MGERGGKRGEREEREDERDKRRDTTQRKEPHHLACYGHTPLDICRNSLSLDHTKVLL